MCIANTTNTLRLLQRMSLTSAWWLLAIIIAYFLGRRSRCPGPIAWSTQKHGRFTSVLVLCFSLFHAIGDNIIHFVIQFIRRSLEFILSFFWYFQMNESSTIREPVDLDNDRSTETQMSLEVVTLPGTTVINERTTASAFANGSDFLTQVQVNLLLSL